MLEGRNYLEYKDSSKFLTVAIVVSKDIKKALKRKEYPIIEAL